jgi:polysaccharide export outer membrane protein
MGAVNRPLVFQVSQPTTLLEALARAGGITPVAGSNILVTHSIVGQNGQSLQTTQTIPTRTLIDSADPSLNIELRGGDEILVPQAHKIYVLGNVKTPGAFPVQDNGYTTVLQGLALAGGLSPDAHKTAFIYRKDGSGGKQEIPVQLAKILKRKSPDVHLNPDDILYVPDNSGRRFAKTVVEFTLPAAVGAIIYAALIP